MSNQNFACCPKCGKSFLEVREVNCNYSIYVHSRDPGTSGLIGLIKYCIVSNNVVYDQSIELVPAKPLNPNYKRTKHKF